MANHAAALAKSRVKTDLVGFLEGPPDPEIGGLETRVVPLPGFERWPRLFRGVFLIVSLMWTLLFRIERPTAILAQTPPAVPTLPVILMAGRLRGARVVVDWHNLGYTLLAQKKRSADGFLVRFYRGCERELGPMADGHLAVSDALADRLERSWGVKDVAVCRDRRLRAPSSIENGDALRAAVGTRFFDSGDPSHEDWLLGVAPTSWTLDEDLWMLVEALERLEGDAGGKPIHLLVTGRGPGRNAFESRLAKRDLGPHRIATGWMEHEDYPRLLAAADFGVCLHRSSSGLDLPIKLADMAAAALPTLTLDFAPVLGEIFQEDAAGKRFSTVGDLSRLLDEVSHDTMEPSLTSMREGLLSDRESPTWDQEWEAYAKPSILPST